MIIVHIPILIGVIPANPAIAAFHASTPIVLLRHRETPIQVPARPIKYNTNLYIAPNVKITFFILDPPYYFLTIITSKLIHRLD